MKIDRYEVLDEVGQGAMGTVYRARDPLIERAVAIKTVLIAQLRQEGSDAEARFLREAQSAGRLSHPNIVTIYDVGEADGLAYIAMEYLSGATLRDVMNKGPMPLDLALDTTIQMAEALAFAHENGVIHRDIKPANVVIVGQRGCIKLTDFGIAHLLNSDRTQTGQMLGSPRYMSPEQAMGRDVDGHSDIFSLGAVLYEMLTGQYAFDGDSLPAIVYRVVNETPASAVSLRPQLPSGLAGLLDRMLSKNPEARPDARTLADALHALVPAVPASSVPASSAPPSSARKSRLLPILAFGTPIGIFLLIGLGIIVIKHFLPEETPEASVNMPRQTETGGDFAGAVTPEAPVNMPRQTDQARKPDSQRKIPKNLTAARQSAVEPASQPPRKPAAKTDAYLAGLDKKQVELRVRRTELLLEFTEQHPDVAQIDRQLEQLRVERHKHMRQLQEGLNR